MWTLILDPPMFEEDKLVTDEEGNLISGRLKLAYDLSYEFLENKKALPEKPEDMDEAEWSDSGFKAALEKLLVMIPSKDRKQSSGAITIAIFDHEASDFLSHLNLQGFLFRHEPNRRKRRQLSKLMKNHPVLDLPELTDGQETANPVS